MRYVVILMLLLAGCGGGSGSPVVEPPSSDASPTDSPETPAGRQSITGTLGGDAALEGGCAWVDDGSTRWQVAWPPGYAVSFDPLTLNGPDGELAQEGDTLTVTGSEQTDVMTTCQVGPVWAATDVTADG